MENQQVNPKIDSQHQKGSPPQPGPPRFPRQEFITWILILTFFAVWHLLVVSPKARPEVNVPYSAFLDQVRASNVAKVHIVGDEITGSFVKPIPWHESKEATTPSVPSNSKTSPATKPAQSSSAAPLTYSEFQTTFPSAIGDPNLISMLEAHKVVVDVAHPPSAWLLELLASWFPMLLLVGFLWWMGRKAAQNQAGLFGLGRSKARRYNESEPRLTFDDVAGADEAKSDLQDGGGLSKSSTQVPQRRRAHSAGRSVNWPAGDRKNAPGAGSRR
jgi:cell division protease FtsH